MRIVIDMQGAQTESRFRGIGRYTSSLVKAIIENRGAHEIVIVLSSQFPETIQSIRNSLYGLLPQRNIIIWYAPGPTFEADHRNKLRKDCAELLYENFIALLRPDILLITSLFEGIGDNAISSVGKLEIPIPTACILYDLIPLISPDEDFSSSPLHQEFYKNKLTSLMNCSCLLAISESSRQEALTALNINFQSVINISGACDKSFNRSISNQKLPGLLFDKLGIESSYIMYAGGADDRKNLHRLIQAFSNLPDQILEKHQLVLAGKMPIARVQSLRKNAKKCGLKASKLIFTGYVSDEELSILYSNCKIFVFPSLHEGFGLPPLEAMNYGAIVIASNTTSLPEVVGNPEALFDPLSVESISQKLMQSLTDNAFRDRALLHGAEQVKLFSWDKSAKLAILAMEHVSKKWYEEEKYKQNFERINRATVIDALSKTEISKGVDDGYVRSLANSMALNEPRIGEIQLLLDISTIVHSDAKSGIQRVVRSLLWELLSNPPVGYIVRPIFLDGTVYRYAAVSEFGLQSGVILKKQPLTFFWAGDIYLALDLNMHLVPVMHILHEAMRARGVSLNFIVYDLLLASNPEWWLQPNPKLFLDWLKSICSVADNLICISDSVRQELKHWIGENNSFQITGLPNLKYFHLGADIENSQPSRGVPSDSESKLSKLQQGISFLMVGTIEPRKGHKQVLDAFELIWKSDSDSRLILVIVGKAGWLVDTLIKKIVNHKELGKRLFWFEGVSDEYINRIYSASDCLVAASYGEGFGLPLIEAAQHGLPIIARNIPVFKEVAGESAFYFDGVTPEEFLDSIVTWHDLYQKFLHPRTEGLQYLTWKKCTEDLIKTLNIQTYSGYNGAAD